MIDIAQAVRAGGDRISVSDAELLIKACKYTNAQNIVEIGSMYGGSTIILADHIRESGGEILVTIEPIPTDIMVENIKNRGLDEYVNIIVGYSPWIKLDLLPRPIDALFIDGDHRTRNVIVDYHYFSPFVRKGGIICIHDYCQGGNKVNEYVREAVEIILRDDDLDELMPDNTDRLSTIAFIKKREMGISVSQKQRLSVKDREKKQCP